MVLLPPENALYDGVIQLRLPERVAEEAPVLRGLNQIHLVAKLAYMAEVGCRVELWVLLVEGTDAHGHRRDFLIVEWL
ncbi:hypothetical protein D3C77_415630 [compost metagenome]